MGSLLARFRAWWRARHRPVTMTITLPAGHPLTVTESWVDGGTFHLSIGGQAYVVRRRWWDTPASVVRKFRRALDRDRVPHG